MTRRGRESRVESQEREKGGESRVESREPETGEELGIGSPEPSGAAAGSFLALESRRSDLDFPSERDSKVRCHNLEIHVSHGCNLTCEQCSHFSNYGFRGHLSPADARAWLGAWAVRLEPKWVSLLGGEPTLNPALCEIVAIARETFPRALVQLVTNGWFLHRYRELPDVLERHNVRLELSVHHGSEQYLARVAEILMLLLEWRERKRFSLHVRRSYSRWRRLYRSAGADLRPVADGDAEAAWEACGSRDCLQIHEGKLWKCPPVAYLRLTAEKYSIDRTAWGSWLDYRPLEPGCTDDELREFLARGAERVCELCPANPEAMELRSPLSRAGKGGEER
mgnify:FL=1